ncbi:hydroxyphenylacetyl-CoA thioesterase PaaI [Natrinema gelatinilyticum]|uniref:hydroxyphenylacetyl-CoA thioesterase PaaI n=1 Tax=Natrinema gelatinilyticum TaxID=2961571 RepID=UPI0020C45AF2|nr:hydroxyphenylacetyl-CoA thioesterase PaaI [Natrinema gelatinilyticum]
MSDVSGETRSRIDSDPYCETLGIEIVALDTGFARMELTITEELLNFHGTPHGAAIYSLADAAFAAASNSHGDAAVGLEANISYLEAADTDETLTATAEETHISGRTAEYEIVVTGENGNRVATFRGRVYRP